MQDFILTVLFNIQGIGAASGLIFHDGKILLIADNSNCLYTYDIAASKLDKTALEPYGISENIAKSAKPDYEAIAIADGKLYLFGSGSTEKRNWCSVSTYPDLRRKSIYDLSKLYEKMRKTANISTDDFNLEGATKHNGKWYFFQRGNGPVQMNGVFTVEGNITTGDDQKVTYKAVPLPDCNGVPATFTDAISVGNKIYFTATAENSNSVYHDGEILGSVIGCLNPETMAVEFTKLISKTNKFEGLTVFENNKKAITFLLCEDSDSDASDSKIYKLVLPK